MFYKLIYLLGERLKNPLISKFYKVLLESDFASKEELHDIQLKKLKMLLTHAREYSPYYKSILQDLDIENMSMDVLESLPIISREVLREKAGDIQNNPFNEKLVQSKSSGSTSKALLFERNKEWEAAHRAAQLRGYSWYGINPWDKNLYFWGFSPEWKDLIKIRILDFFMNRYRVFSYGERELERVANYIPRCQFIEGYSSSIFVLAQYLKKNKRHFEHIKLVKGTSEKIFDYYQEPVKDVFSQKIVSEYGAAEAGIIAFECPHGKMHISMENMIVEEMNGKIYITNLHSTAFPLIRYELGDEIILDKNYTCECGRAHDVIHEVIGRVGQMIEGENEFYPTATLSYISKTLASKHQLKIAYFAKQYQKGEVILDVICDWKDKLEAEKKICDVAYEFYQSDMHLKVNFIEKIDRGNKKITYFESFIPKDSQE